MMGPQRGNDDEYGPWPWITGFAAGAFILWLMFHLATGFA